MWDASIGVRPSPGGFLSIGLTVWSKLASDIATAIKDKSHITLHLSVRLAVFYPCFSLFAKISLPGEN